MSTPSEPKNIVCACCGEEFSWENNPVFIMTANDLPSYKEPKYSRKYYCKDCHEQDWIYETIKEGM